MHYRYAFAAWMLLSSLALGADYRIMTYNVLEGFQKGKTFEEGAAWIAEQKPDLLALQELNNFSEDRLLKAALEWGHEHTVLLKTFGYPVGLTAKSPIKLIQKRLKGMHHGFLQCEVDGIQVFVIHLHPGDYTFRLNEARVLTEIMRPYLDANRPLMVLGDFNAHSVVDDGWLSGKTAILERRGKRNLRKGQFDFRVLAQFAGLGLTDAIDKVLPMDDNSRTTFPTQLLQHANSPAKLERYRERIDYIMLSPRLADRLSNAWVAHDDVLDRVSDHYPVIAELKTD